MYPNLVAECGSEVYGGRHICGVHPECLAIMANMKVSHFQAVLNGTETLTVRQAKIITDEMNRCAFYRPLITKEYLLSPTLSMCSVENDKQKENLRYMKNIIVAFCDETEFDYNNELRQLFKMVHDRYRCSAAKWLSVIERLSCEPICLAEYRSLVDYHTTVYGYFADECRRQQCGEESA